MSLDAVKSDAFLENELTEDNQLAWICAVAIDLLSGNGHIYREQQPLELRIKFAVALLESQ